MIRRGFLAGLGALASMGRGAAGNQRQFQAVGAMQSVASGGVGSIGNAVGAAPSGPRGDYRIFDRLMQPAYARQRRQLATMELLGGYPPHVASCHSWAPWFRAQRAAAWAQAERDRFDIVEQAMRRAAGFLSHD